MTIWLVETSLNAKISHPSRVLSKVPSWVKNILMKTTVNQSINQIINKSINQSQNPGYTYSAYNSQP